MADAFVFLVAFVSFIIFVIVLPLWVYTDAQQHSPQSELLWALVTFFGGIVGFLLYLLIGRDTDHSSPTNP